MEDKNSNNNQTNLPGNKQISKTDVEKLETSGGSQIPQPLKHTLETEFGADLSKVRIHTGANAARMTAALGAQAFTVGNHVVFQPGSFQPHTEAGKRMLAHELAHIVQQRGGGK